MDPSSLLTPGRPWFAMLGALAVMTGCGSSSAAPGQRAASATPAQRLDLGVVAVMARIGGDRVESTGVVIDVDRGLIVTTAHSVWGARSLKVATGIAVLHGRIVARDTCDDLAVLETQPRVPGLVAVRPTGDVPLAAGQPIVSVRRRAGLPSGGQPDLITQRVAVGGALAGSEPRFAAEHAVALAAPDLPPAASGSPLIGADGRLAGLAQVIRRRGRTLRTALSWNTIEQRLHELQPGGRAAYVGWRRHYRCAGVLHRYAAERHPGYRRADARLNAPVPATRLPGTAEVDG